MHSRPGGSVQTDSSQSAWLWRLHLPPTSWGALNKSLNFLCLSFLMCKIGYLPRGFCWGQNELIYTEHFRKVRGMCYLSSYIQYQPHSFYKLQSIPLPNCNIISFSEGHLLCWLFQSFAIINNVSVNILWNRGIFYHDHQIKSVPYLTFVCSTDDLNTF